MERYKIQKAIILFVILLFIGCAHSKPVHKEITLKFQSEIPIQVTIQKNSCEGNWNFCDIDNHNFKKWE